MKMIDRNILNNYTLKIFNFIKKCLNHIWNIGKIYIIWIILYYIASQLYFSYCVPFTILGFITAPILVTTPYCMAFRWCITHGAEVITSMWIILGSWLVSLLVSNGDN